MEKDKKCDYCGFRGEDVEPAFDVYLCENCYEVTREEIRKSVNV